MERHKLWGLALALLLLLGLGAWLLGRSKGSTAADEPERSAEATNTKLEQSRRASKRPELERAAKAAIAGTVRDRDGNPIAGAQICAWPRVDDLEGLSPGQPRCTKSEADGRYRLDELFPVRMVVNAEARGFFPQRWFAQHESYREDMLQLRAGLTREGVDFVLRKGGAEVKGVVRDISGGVIEGAFVWVVANGFGDPGRSAALSDAEGRFTLWTAPGRVMINADADGYATGYRASIAPGGTVEVVMTPESVISGRVVMAGSGEPVAGVIIDAEAEGFFSDGQGHARSDDAGNFRIDKLEPGIYTLGARGDELYGEAVELVHLGLAETASDIVIELHPAFMVTGEVVIASGTQPRPCPRGMVRLQDRSDERNSRMGITNDGGELELRSLLPGTYRVEVRCDGTVPEREYPDVEVTDASVSGLVWEVREGLAIRGQVVDTQGSPVAGAEAWASMKTNADDPRQQMTQATSAPTLDDGMFAAVGLLPGTYEVRLSYLDRFQGEPVTVELEPGADVNDVRLVTPDAGTLTGIVRDADGRPVAGVGLLASSLERQSRSVGMSDDEGRFIIEHVAPGEARIIASDGHSLLRAPGTSDDDEQGTLAQVRAGETTEVELVVESRNATIRGRVLDEHGSPVADAFVSHQRVSDSAAAGASRGKQELRWRFDDRPVLTERDGSFVIDGLANDASYVLGAFRKGGGEAVSENVRSGESVELTIVDTGEIAGKVVIANSEAAPERVELTLNNDAEGLRRTDELFRSGGAFRMQELPPGTYTLTVESPAGAARVEGIELAAGEVKDDIIVELSPRVTVRGRLIDIDTREPVAGMSVSIGARGTSMSFRAENSGDAPHISDAAGRFEVANAQTGKVLLAVVPRTFSEDTRYAWLLIPYQIPASEDVVDIGDVALVAERIEDDQKPGDIGFELKEAELGAEPEMLVPTVALIRPGGPADGSGLAVGDVIETVNGHDVRGYNYFRFKRLTQVAPGQSFELGVAGGTTVTITAGPPID